MGTGEPIMPLEQLDVRRDGLCVAGGSVEPTVSPDLILAALEGEEIEAFRPLLPVGYDAVARAYASAAQNITADDLTGHYTLRLEYFHDEFAPAVKQRLVGMTGGAWDLDDYVPYASGTTVHLMTHLIQAVAARESVHLFPGDWYGFLVGSPHQRNIRWDSKAQGRLACL